MMDPALRKLPIGIQSFQEIRTNHYVYVDKTEYVWRLVETGKSYFLSRPRRFGKSLLISTLEAYFQGKRELFQGLAIEKYENEKEKGRWMNYPVLRFSLSGGDYRSENGLAQRLSGILSGYERKYSIQTDGVDLPNRFIRLIEYLNEKSGKQVVVLVDEYDKPLLESMENEEREKKNRNLYKSFFSILKDEDDYLKFVFFAGVTKFNKVSVFSDLNQLNDISLSSKYASLCGITDKELKDTFQPEIDRMAKENGIGREECLEKLAGMYDGYHFAAKGDGVYNPFSLLNAFDKEEFGAYWFETGTPTFLIERLQKSSFTSESFADGVETDEMRLQDYQMDNPDPVPLFYQTGYLTIKDFNEKFRMYRLGFPNREVKYGFLNSLAPAVLGSKNAESPLSLYQMILNLEAGKVDSFMTQLSSLFAGIPYDEGNAPEYEQEWRNQVYLIFALLGQNISCEVHSARGRADCVIQTKNYIYIFELKLDKTADEALGQIEEKGYGEPYRADGRTIIEVGINFSSKKRNVESWKMK